MEKQDLEYLNQRIQQVEGHVKDRFDTHERHLQKVAQELREQINDLLEQISQSIGTDEICHKCQDCPLCQLHTLGANLKDCMLLRGNTNDRR